MDTLNKIEKLAKIAKNDSPPTFNALDTIMAEIGGMAIEKPNFILPVKFFTAVSAIAASIVIFLSINAWHSAVNPMIQIIMPLQEVSLW